MAGRPPLRIGAHGKIRRRELEPGRWAAACRYRDTDGVVREVTRYTPVGKADEYGNHAEDALLDHLAERTTPATATITENTTIGSLVDGYMSRIIADGEHAPRTIRTYRDGVEILRKRLGSVRAKELSPGIAHDTLRAIREQHGDVRGSQCKTILRAAMLDAVLAGAIPTNPVDQLTRRAPKRRTGPSGSPAVDHADLPRLLKRLRTSVRCRRWDLTDPVTLATATGVRLGELLGIRWVDVDLGAEPTLVVAGHIYREQGEGLVWAPGTKTGPGRPLPLPQYAADSLRARLGREGAGPHGWVFASATGGLRDPDNFNARWRDARPYLGAEMAAVTMHSFRKMVATVADDAGLSARMAADQLGHARPSMTTDNYMRRGTAHREIAAALEAAAQTAGESAV